MNTPVIITNKKISSYSISPSLPNGLSFNIMYGFISGKLSKSAFTYKKGVYDITVLYDDKTSEKVTIQIIILENVRPQGIHNWNNIL